MTKIFLDCGFYAGMVLRRYADEGIIDKGWKVYAFEPNPDLEAATRVKDFFEDLNVSLIEKAVWINSGEVKFHIGGRNDAASIEGTSGHTDPKEITVDSIDFSRFVDDLPEAEIICSMDIEGAEFMVLDKMLEDNTIDKIKLLDIEFHHRLMNNYGPDDARALIDQIEKRGVEVKLKVDLE